MVNRKSASLKRTTLKSIRPKLMSGTGRQPPDYALTMRVLDADGREVHWARGGGLAADRRNANL